MIIDKLTSECTFSNGEQNYIESEQTFDVNIVSPYSSSIESAINEGGLIWNTCQNSRPGWCNNWVASTRIAGQLIMFIEYTELCAKLTNLRLAKWFSQPDSMWIWILTSEKQGYYNNERGVDAVVFGTRLHVIVDTVAFMKVQSFSFCTIRFKS